MQFQRWESPEDHNEIMLHLGALREASHHHGRRIERLEDQVSEMRGGMAVLSISEAGAHPSPSGLSKFREWLQLLASLKEAMLWLVLIGLGTAGILDPATFKAWGLALIGGG